MPIFNFKLYPFKECALPLTRKKDIGYYWLTDSIFYVKLGNVKIYESSKEYIEKYKEEPRYLSYQYIHFLEFFFESIERLANPIPKEIYEKFDTYEKWEKHARLINNYSRHDGFEDIQDSMNNICEFFWQCIFDSMFLASNPTAALYRIENNVRIYYDFSQKDEKSLDIWSAGAGQADIPFDTFVKETEDMLDRFFSGMEKQIEDAFCYIKDCEEKDKYTQHEKEEIMKHLNKEQKERKEYFYGKIDALKNKTYKYDFDKLIKDYAAVNKVIEEHKAELL